MGRSRGKAHPAEEAVRKHALSYPNTHEDFPWGHSAIKVGKKAFVFMGTDGGGFGLSVKLAQSHQAALTLPFAQPTGYGLGKSGWVSAEFGPEDEPPLGLLRQWVDESYRAVAPKTLVKQLDGAPPPKAKRPKAKAGARRRRL